MGFGRGKGFSPEVVPPTPPVPGVQSNDCQQTEDDFKAGCQYWGADSQTFTPDHDYVAVGLSLLLEQWSVDRKGPLIVKLELPAANCWEAEVLWSQAVYSTDLPIPGEKRWTHFVLPEINLTEDTTYRITVHTTPGWLWWNGDEWVPWEAGAIIAWYLKVATNPYTRGAEYAGCNYQAESGAWADRDGYDATFCVYE